MAYKYDFINVTTGFDNALTQLGTQVPSFIPTMLFFVFMVVTLGGMIAQKKRTGYADAPLWATLGSVATLMIALPLTITAGIINITTLSIVVTITLICGIWLFMDKSNREI